MRKSSLVKNHKRFDDALARYRVFMEKIINAQRVVSDTLEKRDIAESVILRLCANWEAFVDEHLIDCINADASKLSVHFNVKIPKHPDKGLCQVLIFGKNGYTDFRSFGDLKGYSKKILPDTSNPFLDITQTQSKKIDEVYKIRNYLSHYSMAAKNSLKKLYKEEYNMDRFLEPGQFLLAYNAKRLWHYFGIFEGTSTRMKNWAKSSNTVS